MSAVTYPVHVDAQLDSKVSRWLWLFKWLLAIPHYIVLAFLWLAFVVLSVVAFFAILFTGRYPRSIFEFNVGVLRWSGGSPTTPTAPSAPTATRPSPCTTSPTTPRTSRWSTPSTSRAGLVLVKWWLLAIPHYMVVGLLVGGAGYASATLTTARAWVATGLIGLLVVVAGVSCSSPAATRSLSSTSSSASTAGCCAWPATPA